VPAPSAPQPGSTPQSIIRNFCIIAHIDHGKSTLADRMLQLTGVVSERNARAQYLDRMDIERERGITIKSQAVRMPWTVSEGGRAGSTFVLNMIDTPGHVDFTYEVSRSLEACEAAVLLVDAAQGIEAQTLANLYLALGADLHVIPVLNKIDLPSAQPEKYAAELAGIIGCDPSEVLRVSAKTGFGVEPLLNEIVRQTLPPQGDPSLPARALIFDSVYDTYRGVVTYVRVVDGKLTHRDRIKMMSTGAVHEMLEVGVISPEPVKAKEIGVGEVGYLITGVKEVRQSRVGDTVTWQNNGATEPLSGYKHPNPMVFAGLYPIDGDDYPTLRDALDKLQLNDAALAYEPETSGALGFGFRIGFLGLLHMEIVRERLGREFNLDRPQCRLPGRDGGRHRAHRHQPQRIPRRQDRRGLRAGCQSDRAGTRRLHRHDHGPVPDPTRHAAGHGLPVRGPGRDALLAAARRDRLRLLRRAEVSYEGLRKPRLRAHRGAVRRPGEGGRAPARRPGRRLQRDRAP
jgi:GTP-binding protein LepA